MLSLADSAVASRDPALPGLATILDAEALAHRIGRASGRVIERAELRYLRYKPGTNCLGAYAAVVDGVATSLYAKAYGADASVKLDKACPGPGTDPLRIRLDRSAVLACIFPGDLKLPVLARLADAEARRRLMQRIFDDRPGMESGRLETLAYKPERRYVARWTSEAESAVVKFYTGSARATARAGSRAVASREVLRIARKAGGSKRHGVLAFEWLPGQNLRELLGEPAPLPAVRRVGRAIAELHGQSSPTLPIVEGGARLRELRELAEILGIVCPSARRRAGKLVRAIAARLSSEGPATGCIHGDLYDKQILVDGDRVALIDLDRAAIGDPRIDMGLLFAHLDRDVVLGRLSRSRVEEIEGATIDAYQEARGRALGPLGGYVAEALLHLAHHPFRTHLPDWPDLCAAILDAAERRLAQSD